MSNKRIILQLMEVEWVCFVILGAILFFKG